MEAARLELRVNRMSIKSKVELKKKDSSVAGRILLEMRVPCETPRLLFTRDGENWVWMCAQADAQHNVANAESGLVLLKSHTLPPANLPHTTQCPHLHLLLTNTISTCSTILWLHFSRTTEPNSHISRGLRCWYLNKTSPPTHTPLYTVILLHSFRYLPFVRVSPTEDKHALLLVEGWGEDPARFYCYRTTNVRPRRVWQNFMNKTTVVASLPVPLKYIYII